MDLFEIELENQGLLIAWFVTHNGVRIAQGVEFSEDMALERSQHCVDVAFSLSRLAA